MRQAVLSMFPFLSMGNDDAAIPKDMSQLEHSRVEPEEEEKAQHEFKSDFASLLIDPPPLTEMRSEPQSIPFAHS